MESPVVSIWGAADILDGAGRVGYRGARSLPGWFARPLVKVFAAEEFNNHPGIETVREGGVSLEGLSRPLVQAPCVPIFPGQLWPLACAVLTDGARL